MLDKLSKLFLLAVATVLVTAVLTTGPSDPVWAKKKDSGDGGTTSIDVDTFIRDGNVLKSDGVDGGRYVDGVQNVTSEVTPEGEHKLATNKTGKVGSGRPVFLDFGSATCAPKTVLSLNPPTFDDCGDSGVAPNGCAEVAIRTVNATLHSLGPDRSNPDAGLIVGLGHAAGDRDFA